jgi:hypothetical protein
MTRGSLVPGVRVSEPAAETRSNRGRRGPRSTDCLIGELDRTPLTRPGRGVPPPRSGPPPLGVP